MGEAQDIVVVNVWTCYSSALGFVLVLLRRRSGRNRWSLPFRVAVVNSGVVLVGVVTGVGNLDRFLFRDGRGGFGPMGGGVRG